jgi:hypothetical protein
MNNTRIDDLAMVNDYLQKKEIVYLQTKNGDKTYFYLRHGAVRVKAPHSSYVLPLTDFLQLYQHATFFLYQPDPSEPVIDELKDAEYYAWKQQGGH